MYELINKRRFILFCSLILNMIILILIIISQCAKSNITYQESTPIPTPILTPPQTTVQEVNQKYYDIPLSHDLQDFTMEICKKYNVDEKIIFAMMKIESDFDNKNKTPNESESGNSEGIMQLNTGDITYLKWYKELTGIKDFDVGNVKHNIEGGIAVYKFYNNYWASKGYEGTELLQRSLNSYNMGIGGIKKHIRKTGNTSRSYDRAIIKYKNKIVGGT